MSILNFAWVADGAAFDPGLHSVQDEAVRALEIEEREGAVPLCRVVVERPAAGLLAPGRLQHAFISETADGATTLLFHGRLIAAPADLEGPFATLEFEPAVGDMDGAVATALMPLKTAPFWDGLFVRPGAEADASEILDARHAALCIDRSEASVFVSDSLTGRGVSSSSVAVGGGAKDFAVPAGLAWQPGMRLRAARQGDLSVSMSGVVSAYGGGTLTLDVDETTGAGTFDDWLVSIDFRGHAVDGESVSMRTLGKPLREVRATVAAEWVQSDKGVIDVGAVIRRQQGGVIATLSPKFARRWPRPGAPVGANSGYCVVASALDAVPAEPFDLLARDADGDLVHFSPPIRVLSVMREQLRIFRYIPRLAVSYDFAQKRREVVRFTLAGNAQALAGDEAGGLDLDFALRDVGRDDTPLWVAGTAYAPGDEVNFEGEIFRALTANADAVFDPAKWEAIGDRSPIGDRRRASFFLTDRGKRALDHAIEVAAARLAASQRAVAVSFRVWGWPPELRTLGCDHTATVASPKLPGGTATGKVIAVRLFRDGESGTQGGEVTIAASVGLGYVGSTPVPANAYVEAGFVDDGMLAETGDLATEGRGITYQSYAAQQPTQGLVHLAALGDDDWVESASFANLFADQFAFLKDHEWYGPKWGEDRTANMAGGHFQLPLVETDLTLEMIDITGSDALVHKIFVTPTHSFGRIATIDLGA